MKQFTKRLCILLAVILTMVFGLCGCTSSNVEQPNVTEATAPQDPELAWFEENVPEPEVTQEILALKQDISTVEEAMEYLSGRYSQLYMGSGLEANSMVMHMSAQEGIQPHQEVLFTHQVAPILTYLLEDDLDAFTLLAYTDMANIHTVLCIQHEGHYEILDPARQMPADWDDLCMPTGTFDSLESYAEAVFADEFNAVCIYGLYQMPDTGRCFFRMENDTATLLNEDAVLIRDNRELFLFRNPEMLREKISTIEEVAAFLDERHPKVYMKAHTWNPETDPENYWYLRDINGLFEKIANEGIDRNDVVRAASYLLADDMEIYSVIGFGHDKFGGMPLKPINCIKTDSGYQFVDPVRLMQGEQASRYGTMLPEATVGSLEEYVELCKTYPGLALYVDYLYLFSDVGKIEVVEDSRGVATVLPRGNSQLLWDNTAKNDLTQEQYRQLQASYIDPQYISAYDLYYYLGGITLTPDEARALVDAQPEVVKEQVKTAADLLMYMLAANIQECDGCYCDNWDGYTWHTNMNARQVMQTRLGNCGSCANLANYLLEGDYEEVGYMDHALFPGSGGSHVYNYIFHEGKYYVLDFSWYMYNGYDLFWDYSVPVMDSLAEWSQLVENYYSDVNIIVSYTSPGQQLPCIFEYDQYWDTGEAYYYFPEGAEYTVLYQSSMGFQLAEKPLSKSHYDWMVFWDETDREPKGPKPSNMLTPPEDEQITVSVNYANPENIAQYDLYEYLGGTTLTPEGAKALVNAKPEEVKEQVKTAADLLMYMLAANIRECDGCYCDNWDGDIWHTNMNARQVMQTKLAVCGSSANLANYLLEGDYEEVGFMDHALFPGKGGSHVYNYIFHEGKYYILDFSWYMFNKYDPSRDYSVPVMDSLSEWPQLVKDYFGDVNIIVSYTSTGQQLPCIFSYDNYQNTGEAYYYFPEGAEYTVIYEADGGFRLAQKPFNKTYYDWTVFWGETDRAPKNPA